MRGEQVSGEYVGTGSFCDADGWFPTRDAGWLDEDGYLYIEGRADDTIIRGGENIAPAEIEDVLLRHPAVLDAAAVGLPDEQWGQRIAAAVTLRPGSDAEPDELLRVDPASPAWLAGGAARGDPRRTAAYRHRQAAAPEGARGSDAGQCRGRELSSMPRVIAPVPNRDDEYFWTGVAQGRLFARRCAHCSFLQQPPSPMCPRCGSVAWEAHELSGRGVVYSWIVSRHPTESEEPARIVALIDLEEGCRLVSNLRDVEPAAVTGGMPVEVTFVEIDGVTLPQFRPAGGRS